MTRNPVKLQNIEDMRQQAGIDDADLHQKLGGLKIGDLVRLTLIAGEKAGDVETVLVRITEILGVNYHGALTQRPKANGLKQLPAGELFTFTAGHIHSVQK